VAQPDVLPAFLPTITRDERINYGAELCTFFLRGSRLLGIFIHYGHANEELIESSAHGHKARFSSTMLHNMIPALQGRAKNLHRHQMTASHHRLISL
jgi:hypothetical protein